VQETRDKPGYHCLVSWSGGKDSTFVLWLLSKKFDLSVLAFTFDNGFVSPGAISNMRTVAERLDIDHVIVKPRFELMREVFNASTTPGMYPPRALERASGICNSCMGLAKGIALRMALEKEIPILAYGWSPGQIPIASALFAMNARMLKAMVETAVAPLKRATDEQIEMYFPQERHLDDARTFPYNVSPLIFVGFDEEKAVHTIKQHGWVRPLDTDPNSTNCLLNSYANQLHLQQMGYHPYAMELAGLVREGYMSREEALSRLTEPGSSQVIAQVRTKLERS
jgi:hypothetical protein